MTNIDRELFFSIASDYTPYDQFEEFHEGFLDFEHGLHHNTHDASPGKDFEAQAWTCGQEAALRYVRAAGEHTASSSPSREHSVYTRYGQGGAAMKGTIELVAGSGLDGNDIEEIQNAIEAALQGTRYEEVFSVTTTRETESDTSIYYLKISAPLGGITDDYADMKHRLQSSLLCHVEFASL